MIEIVEEEEEAEEEEEEEKEEGRDELTWWGGHESENEDVDLADDSHRKGTMLTTETGVVSERVAVTTPTPGEWTVMDIATSKTQELQIMTTKSSPMDVDVPQAFEISTREAAPWISTERSPTSAVPLGDAAETTTPSILLDEEFVATTMMTTVTNSMIDDEQPFVITQIDDLKPLMSNATAVQDLSDESDVSMTTQRLNQKETSTTIWPRESPDVIQIESEETASGYLFSDQLEVTSEGIATTKVVGWIFENPTNRLEHQQTSEKSAKKMAVIETERPVEFQPPTTNDTERPIPFQFNLFFAKEFATHDAEPTDQSEPGEEEWWSAEPAMIDQVDRAFETRSETSPETTFPTTTTTGTLPTSPLSTTALKTTTYPPTPAVMRDSSLALPTTTISRLKALTTTTVSAKSPLTPATTPPLEIIDSDDEPVLVPELLDQTFSHTYLLDNSSTSESNHQDVKIVPFIGKNIYKSFSYFLPIFLGQPWLRLTPVHVHIPRMNFSTIST